MTSTGVRRLRSADPKRFRTRPSEQRQEADDPHGAGFAPTDSFGRQYDRPECRQPLACSACGGTNINGAEERGGAWYVWCVACDSRQPSATL